MKYIMRKKVNQEGNPENEHLQNVHNMALFAGGISFIISGLRADARHGLEGKGDCENEI